AFLYCSRGKILTPHSFGRPGHLSERRQMIRQMKDLQTWRRKSSAWIGRGREPLQCVRVEFHGQTGAEAVGRTGIGGRFALDNSKLQRLFQTWVLRDQVSQMACRHGQL